MALQNLYNSGSYNFEHIALVVDENSKASAHLNSLMNLYWTPTCYMDAGNQIYVGTSQSSMGNAIANAGTYAVNDVDLTISVAWLGSAQIEVTVKIKNNQFINTAPATPATPGAPEVGVSGGDVTLTATTTDPDDHNVWYMFDFTNMVFSDWIGPFASGEEGTYSHAWDSPGDQYPFRVKAKDEYGDETDWSPYNYINIGRRGDANGDNSLNIGDAVYLISYIFKGGPSPNPLDLGDANCDGGVNIGDAVNIINYIFGGGSIPSCD